MSGLSDSLSGSCLGASSGSAELVEQGSNESLVFKFLDFPSQTVRTCPSLLGSVFSEFYF